MELLASAANHPVTAFVSLFSFPSLENNVRKCKTKSEAQVWSTMQFVWTGASEARRNAQLELVQRLI